jgi:hypothetical protein
MFLSCLYLDASFSRPKSFVVHVILHSPHDLSCLDRPYLYTINTRPHDIYSPAVPILVI